MAYESVLQLGSPLSLFPRLVVVLALFLFCFSLRESPDPIDRWWGYFSHEGKGGAAASLAHASCERGGV